MRLTSHNIMEEDFYTNFKTLFDYNLKSFTDFVDIYINPGIYNHVYGSYENIAGYLKSHNSELTTKLKIKKTREHYSDYIQTHIFGWTSESIIEYLEKALCDISSKNSSEFLLRKFFRFLLEDLEKEMEVIVREKNLFNHINSYGPNRFEELNLIDKDINALLTNKELLLKFQKFYCRDSFENEINKSDQQTNYNSQETSVFETKKSQLKITNISNVETESDDLFSHKNVQIIFWEKTEDQLSLLLKLLNKYQFIEPEETAKTVLNYIKISAKFNQKKTYHKKISNKIIWCQKLTDLALLIYLLELEKFITYSASRNKVISNIFCLKRKNKNNGKIEFREFKPDQFRDVISKVKNETSNYKGNELLRDVIETLKQ